MKRIDLYHPRVFDDPAWARKYHRGNAWSIRMMGRRLVDILRKSGFRKGRVLDSGCGFGAVAVEIALAFPETEIVGIDLSRPLLDLASKAAAGAGWESSTGSCGPP